MHSRRGHGRFRTNQGKIKKGYLFLGLVALCWSTWGIYSWLSTSKETQERTVEQARIQKMDRYRAQLADHLGPAYFRNTYPDHVQMVVDQNPEDLQIQYSFDPDLQKEAQKLLQTYKPDYGAVVVMDALSGRVLALQNYERGKLVPTNWALKATFPAASVFKIVTATAAIDRHNLTPETIVFFNGANHTLYKKNVLSTSVNKWTRGMTLKEAFGLSVNTFFGRLALEKLEPQDIEEYAIRFGFNTPVGSELPFDPGFTFVPREKNFQLAEIVSGYNRVTRMSPIQGAMIASSIAADGVMRVPYIVDSLVRPSTKEVVFQAEPITAAVTMSSDGAKKLKVLMEQTVTKGTSRHAFRPFLKDKSLREIAVGGKTGSLYGDNPRGKTDWFVGYAISENQRLAVAAVTTHVDKWTVKSAFLAQSIFKKHFKEQYSEMAESFFSARERAPSSSEKSE